MNCTQCRPLLNAHVDHELDLRASLEMEAHLASCTACAVEAERLRALKDAVRGGATYFAPSQKMADRLRRSLHRERTRVSGRRGWRNGSAVLPAAAALCLIVAVGAVVLRPPAFDRVADEVVAAHVRSLMVDHVTDVLSSDRHTVKPWFQGKLNFSVKVTDGSSQGFPLIGGRLEYLAEQPAAALVYRHGQHIINLFVWPAGRPGDQGVGRLSRRGYTAYRWAHDGMNLWAVSDLNQSQLLDFVHLIQAE